MTPEYKEKIAAAHREVMNRNPNADKVSDLEVLKAELSKGKYEPLTNRESLEHTLASDDFYMLTEYMVRDSGSTLDEYIDDTKHGRQPLFIRKAEDDFRNGGGKPIGEVIKEMNEEFAKEEGITVKQAETVMKAVDKAAERGLTLEQCETVMKEALQEVKKPRNLPKPKKPGPKP